MNIRSHPAGALRRFPLPSIRLLLGLLAAVARPAPAAVLIQVDFSNLSSITFTATGATAGATDSSTFNYDGVTLLGLFTAPASGDLDMGGNLTASGVLQAYDAAFPDDLSGSSVDLNLRTFSGLEVQTFSPDTPAFTGAGTLDLTGLAGLLPAPGTGGLIRAGWSETSGGPGAIIGEWAVVPEVTPAAQAGVLGLAMLGVAAWQRGRLVRRQG